MPKQVLTVTQDFVGKAKGETGGQMVKIFLDDVSFSAAASRD